MNLINHTINWYKGEIFEATIIGITGSIILVVSLLFWKLGRTPNTQAITIPLSIVSLILILASVFMIYNNTRTLRSIILSTIENQSNFFMLEKQRVEDFQSLYTYIKIGAGICFFIAIGLFFITENRHWQAIAIMLILIGFSGLVIDYFSKERAAIYYNELLKFT